MKKLLNLLLVLFVIVGLSSCASYHGHGHRGPHRIPPGHAKKMYGGKSAKHYAPGQQKKKWKNNNKYKGNKGKRHNRKYDTSSYPWK